MVLSNIGYVKNARQYDIEKSIEMGIKIADLLINNHLEISDETEAYLNGMFSVIFDAQTGEIVWFGTAPRSYKFNPMDVKDMKNQLTKLYKAFL